MAVLDRAALKLFFETGDIPTQSEFASLIDSLLNFQNDGVGPWIKNTVSFAVYQPDAGASNFTSVTSIDVGYQPVMMLIKPTIAFTGGGITSSVVQPFYPDLVTALGSTCDVFTAVTANSGTILPIIPKATSGLFPWSGLGTSISLKLTVAGFGASLNSLVAGSLDFYTQVMKLI